jgi:hypothetical protein
VTDSHIFVSTGSATYAVSLSSGQTVWSLPYGGALSLADSTLYIAGSDGFLTAVSTPRLVAQSFTVDAGANGILEPGETGVVSPSWRAALASAAFTGSATAVGNFTVTDGTASYGSVAVSADVSCTTTLDCYGVAIAETRPQRHWDVTLQEALSTGDQHSWVLHVGSSFTDVPVSSTFYPYVETLLHNGVTNGCGPTTFCPAATTLRNQMAALTLRAKEGRSYQPPPCGGTPMFSDVSITDEFCGWIEELARRGVVAGCGDGRYCPTLEISRDQRSKYLIKTLKPDAVLPACTGTVFADVPTTNPFCSWIEELARMDVVQGCAAGYYCPSLVANRDQMAKTLTRTFGLKLTNR